MNIRIYLKDEFGNNVSGVIQIGEFADSTEDGVGTFSIQKGVYRARGLALGYRIKQEEIEVAYDGQEFTLVAVRG